LKTDGIVTQVLSFDYMLVPLLSLTCELRIEIPPAKKCPYGFLQIREHAIFKIHQKMALISQSSFGPMEWHRRGHSGQVLDLQQLYFLRLTGLQCTNTSALPTRLNIDMFLSAVASPAPFPDILRSIFENCEFP